MSEMKEKWLRSFADKEHNQKSTNMAFLGLQPGSIVNIQAPLLTERGLVPVVRSRGVCTSNDVKDDGRFELPIKPDIMSVFDIKVPAQLTVRTKRRKRLNSAVPNAMKAPGIPEWAAREWFQSFIDEPMFAAEYDFRSCLKDELPFLRTKRLARSDWVKVRSLLGKPARFSSQFLSKKRAEITDVRKKIRFMQINRCLLEGDEDCVRFMPKKIPLPLPIGTKVTAHLYQKHNGLFTGTVEAFYPESCRYRINFDNAVLGKLIVFDYDLRSDDFHGTIRVKDLAKFTEGMQALYNPFKEQESAAANETAVVEEIKAEEVVETAKPDQINGLPKKLLEYIVRMRRLLTIKRVQIQTLRALNNEFELTRPKRLNDVVGLDDGQSFASEMDVHSTLREDFKRIYVSTVLKMETLNLDMQDTMHVLQENALNLPTVCTDKRSTTPKEFMEKCRIEAIRVVTEFNLKGMDALNLIKSLAITLIILAKYGADEDDIIMISTVLECYLEGFQNTFGERNRLLFDGVARRLMFIKVNLEKRCN